jgi:hypothetical protein
MSAAPPYPECACQRHQLKLGLLRGAAHPLPLEPIAPNFPSRLRLPIACALCSQVVSSRGSTSMAAPPSPHTTLSLARHHAPRARWPTASHIPLRPSAHHQTYRRPSCDGCRCAAVGQAAVSPPSPPLPPELARPLTPQYPMRATVGCSRRVTS